MHAEPWFRLSGNFTFHILTKHLQQHCFISTCKALRCKLPAHLRPLLPVSPGAFCAPPRVGFWTFLRLWQSYYPLILVVYGAHFLAPSVLMRDALLMVMLVNVADQEKDRFLSHWHGCQLSNLLHFITYNPWAEWKRMPVLKQALRRGLLLCKHIYSGIYLKLICWYWC